MTNDHFLSEEWSLFNFGQVIGTEIRGIRNVDIEAPEAWSITRGDPSVIVAVIDSGVAYDHPDLAPNIWRNAAEIPGNGIDDDHNGYLDDVRGWDFVDGDNDPRDPGVSSASGTADTIAHGTAVASVIAARGDNRIGMAGVAPQVTLLPLRAAPARGLDENAIAHAIDYAAAAHAQIVNLSMASIIPGFTLPLVEAAIRRHPDLLFVASAGNSGNDADIVKPSPCAMDAANVLCVAATDQNDQLAQFSDPTSPGSNYGRTTVDLAAPGAAMLVAQPAQDEVWTADLSHALAPSWVAGSPDWTVTAGALHGAPTPGLLDTWVHATSTVDLTSRSGCRLLFDVRSTLSSSGTVFLETSTDLKTWTLRPGVNGFALTGGTAGKVSTASVPLAISPGSTRIAVGFRLQVPAAGTGAVDISSPRIDCLSGTYHGREYAYAEGTSFAAPEVAGAAALIRSVRPALSVADLRAALLQGAVPVPALQGKTVTGARLDVYRSLLAAEGEQLPAAPSPGKTAANASTSPPTSDASSSPAIQPTSTRGGLVPYLILPANPIDVLTGRYDVAAAVADAVQHGNDVTVKVIALVVATGAAVGVGVGHGLKSWYKNLGPTVKTMEPYLVGAGVVLLGTGLVLDATGLGAIVGLPLTGMGSAILTGTLALTGGTKLAGMWGDTLTATSGAAGEWAGNLGGSPELAAGFSAEKAAGAQSLADHQMEYLGDGGSVAISAATQLAGEKAAGDWLSGQNLENLTEAQLEAVEKLGEGLKEMAGEAASGAASNLSEPWSEWGAEADAEHAALETPIITEFPGPPPTGTQPAG